MPGKGINGRANMQKFQMNSKKYGGNPFKYTSLVSSTGRVGRGGMWNYIQRRADQYDAIPAPAPVAPLDAPTNLTVLLIQVMPADDNDATVTLEWTAPVNTGGSPITDYLLSGDDATYISLGNVTQTDASFSVLNLNVGDPATFYIKAENEAGDISPPVSVTLDAFTPGPIPDNTSFLAAIDGYLGTPAQKETVLKLYRSISFWDTSNVTSMVSAFQLGRSGTIGFPDLNSSTFNEDISDWDVSNVTDMQGMFQDASSFNKDLTWTISKQLTSFIDMFKNATSFNGTLTWTDGAGASTGSIDATAMFEGATAFEGLGLDGWSPQAGPPKDFQKRLGNLSYMFKDASAFQANLKNWRFEGDGTAGYGAVYVGAYDLSGIFHGATDLSANQVVFSASSPTSPYGTSLLTWRRLGESVYNNRLATGVNPPEIPSFYEDGSDYNGTNVAGPPWPDVSQP